MMKKIFALALVPFFLAACGKTLDGTYADASGTIEMTFDGKYVNYMGMMELEYEIDGDKIKIDTQQGGALIFTIKDNKTITSPMIGTLKKQ